LLDASDRSDSSDRRPDPSDREANTLIIAHFNHGWRGEQSLADQAFVAELADQLGRPFATETQVGGDTAAGSEATARTARYRFLKQVTRQYGARYLTTAHTANDQVETILHRVIRGTGLTGLTGIPKTRVFDHDFVLIRPLLAIQRADIEQYLTGLGQTWRHDVTNESVHWTRNRLRHEILPNLREHFHCDVDGSLLQLATTAAAALEALEPQIAELERLVELDNTGFSLPCLPDATPFPLAEALRRAWKRTNWPERAMTAVHWRSLTDVVIGLRSVCNLPGDIRAENHGDRVVVSGRQGDR
jgi:tRNA(Ile)-lysidine synthase